VLLRDAGYVQFLRTFDADDEMISSEVILERGPHPDLDSDFEAFLRRHGSHARALKKHLSVGSRYAAPHPEIAARLTSEDRSSRFRRAIELCGWLRTLLVDKDGVACE
jgi:hypothetical protein